jgi:ABC-type branched-subunit amino acid transport system substrate-binding protein
LSLVTDIDFPQAGISTAISRPDLAAEAAIKTINAAGGVNGHPLQLLVCDSKGNGNVADACARKAVASNAVADVGGLNFTGTPVEIMNAAGYPMIGRTLVNPPEYKFTTVFPYLASGVIGMSAAVYATVELLHKQKIALVTNPPLTAQFFASGSATAKSLGATVTQKVNAQPGADLTSAVLKASQGGTQALATSSSLDVPLVAAARQNGVSLPMVLDLEPSDVVSLGSAADGEYSVSQTQLPTVNNPGIEQMLREFHTYDGTAIPVTQYSIPAWLAVHMFADVTKKLKVINRATVLAAFHDLTKQYAYGIIPPYTTTQKFAGLGGVYPSLYNPWVYLSQVQNRQLVPVNNGLPFDPFAG